MKPNTPLSTQTILKILLVMVTLVLIVLCALLVQQYQYVRHLEYNDARHSFFRSLQSSRPLTAADATSTQTWMTFDYINRVFLMPAPYLQTALSITDSRYPRLTIAEYAKVTAQKPSVALTKVQDAISAFFASKQ